MNVFLLSVWVCFFVFFFQTEEADVKRLNTQVIQVAATVWPWTGTFLQFSSSKTGQQQLFASTLKKIIAIVWEKNHVIRTPLWVLYDKRIYIDFVARVVDLFSIPWWKASATSNWKSDKSCWTNLLGVGWYFYSLVATNGVQTFRYAAVCMGWRSIENRLKVKRLLFRIEHQTHDGLFKVLLLATTLPTMHAQCMTKTVRTRL